MAQGQVCPPSAVTCAHFRRVGCSFVSLGGSVVLLCEGGVVVGQLSAHVRFRVAVQVDLLRDHYRLLDFDLLDVDAVVGASRLQLVIRRLNGYLLNGFRTILTGDRSSVVASARRVALVSLLVVGPYVARDVHSLSNLRVFSYLGRDLDVLHAILLKRVASRNDGSLQGNLDQRGRSLFVLDGVPYLIYDGGGVLVIQRGVGDLYVCFYGNVRRVLYAQIRHLATLSRMVRARFLGSLYRSLSRECKGGTGFLQQLYYFFFFFLFYLFFHRFLNVLCGLLLVLLARVIGLRA